jgi:hypothetical protein
MPPDTPPPPVTNSATGSLDVRLAYEGVQIASDRQSSADDQATAPWLSASPTLSSKLVGSYSDQRPSLVATYCGQAGDNYTLILQPSSGWDTRVNEISLPGPNRVESILLDEF